MGASQEHDNDRWLVGPGLGRWFSSLWAGARTDADGKRNHEAWSPRQTGMWTRVAVLVSVVLVAAVAGCGQSPGRSHGQTAMDPVGTVSGRVGVFGGPLNPKTGRMAADNSPGGGLLISATPADRRVVTTVTGADGWFTLALALGRYSVSPSCGPDQTVVVTPSKPTVVNLRCDVP